MDQSDACEHELPRGSLRSVRSVFLPLYGDYRNTGMIFELLFLFYFCFRKMKKNRVQGKFFANQTLKKWCPNLRDMSDVVCFFNVTCSFFAFFVTASFVQTLHRLTFIAFVSQCSVANTTTSLMRGGCQASQLTSVSKSMPASRILNRESRLIVKFGAFPRS